MNHLHNHSLLLVSGKGGVGKTTLATALAVYYGVTKKVLLCQVNGGDYIGEWFQKTPDPEGDPVNIAPGVEWCNIKPELALKEYALIKLRSRMIYKMIFERGRGAAFALGIPGFSELITWGKIRYHHQQKRWGKKRYDLIIVDLPATGDLMEFLNFPRGVLSVLKRGPIAREMEQLSRWIHNQQKTALCWTTDGNNLSLKEYQAFKDLFQEAGLSPETIFLNRYLPRKRLPEYHKLPEQLRRTDAIYHQKLTQQQKVLHYFSQEGSLFKIPRFEGEDPLKLIQHIIEVFDETAL